jgi:(p)ppGpp synthase/HD superfamily hydrolase
MNLINIIAYAINCHEETNHLYDGKPYTVHLALVDDSAKKYLDLIPADSHEIVIAAGWCHDVIEDCRQTYNDVKEVAGDDVAEIVYAVTNEKGKTRKERANKKYYEGIRNTKWATFVKLCDRIANVKYSRSQKASMFIKYKKEYDDFIFQLRPDKIYSPMVNELAELLDIEQSG